MSDNSILSAVADAGKDLVKETVKQVVQAPSASLQSVKGQIAGVDTDEERSKKDADKMATFQRIMAIEAEMAQIRISTEKDRAQYANVSTTNQPDIISKQAVGEGFQQNHPQKLDEASRQAVGKAEQGRNFKG